ncbi:MAG: hypothetical protein IPL33_11560 [Sphingobacteriales bacterium]|nr:hypothetical protein [Sphingobacteriales bacterium]
MAGIKNTLGQVCHLFVNIFVPLRMAGTPSLPTIPPFICTLSNIFFFFASYFL